LVVLTSLKHGPPFDGGLIAQLVMHITQHVIDLIFWLTKIMEIIYKQTCYRIKKGPCYWTLDGRGGLRLHDCIPLALVPYSRLINLSSFV
jgi:hypothetical protein